MDIEQTVLEDLIENNSRFRMLYEEHMLFEKQLDDYAKKGTLSEDESLEKKKIKKMKLAGKDEMEQILQSVTT